MNDASTIYQVADQAGVSVRTVSRYLNDPNCISQKTSAKIVAAMRELQFRPSVAARALKGVKPNLIGIVSDRITTSPDSFELIKGLQLAAKALGKRLLIAECGGVDADVPELIDGLIEHRVDALIFATHFHRALDAAQLRRAEGTRLVLLNCYLPGGEVPSVVPDDEQGARDGLAHLYTHGHRRIVVFELFPDMRATQLRHRGFLKAAKAAGQPEPVFVQGSQGASIEDEFAAIDSLVGQVLREHRPTAMLAGNDKMAARIIQCLHKRQIAVPGQVSVLGFDDHPMLVHATDPPLTSVRLPYLQMGRRAAQMACDESASGAIRERCEVQVRASVAAPPGRKPK
ncbi:LacI family transcriptional regulator [Ideonella azotifigens]|uniref:LacI family DNA-binding transcriptional regulator n=1 Tax=Ideonella azotifigens TaxID=513160 RepID=A0ABN1K4Y4_9BURK|nr:LacI family DNA-binding transcriptional regulator [Ideonella azotifigens]MCD2344442.1 LacI family transcriptional regulator [Ideonella azotifigens]